jgi:hypothetical protein
MDRLGGLDRRVQLTPRVVQHAADAPQLASSAPLLTEIAYCSPTSSLIFSRDSRCTPASTAHAHAAWLPTRSPTPPRAARPAPRAHNPHTPSDGAPLAHRRHDQRQIALLIADRLTDSLLGAAEPVPAPTGSWQTVHRPADQLIRLGRRPIRPLMTGLRALPAPLTPLALQLLLRTLTRQRATLLMGK